MLERQGRVDREDRVGRHHRSFGERRRHVVVDPRPAGREAGRPVGQELEVEHLEPFAHRRTAGGAAAARAAVREPRTDDVIAGSRPVTPSPSVSTTADPRGRARSASRGGGSRGPSGGPNGTHPTRPSGSGPRRLRRVEPSSSRRRSSTSHRTAARMREVSRTGVRFDAAQADASTFSFRLPSEVRPSFMIAGFARKPITGLPSPAVVRTSLVPPASGDSTNECR